MNYDDGPFDDFEKVKAAFNTPELIQLLNGIQESLALFIEFSEGKPNEDNSQIQSAFERVRYGFRSINTNLKSTVLQVNLKSGDEFGLPIGDLYAVNVLHTSFDPVRVGTLTRAHFQGLELEKVNDQIVFKSQVGHCCFTLFLEPLFEENP